MTEPQSTAVETTATQNTAASMTFSQTLKAILTDVQFWVPALVLASGIVLLVFLH